LLDPWIILGLSVQIFAIMDPLAALPTLMTVIEPLSGDEVRRIVNRASIAVLLLLVIFSVAGGLILQAFGISLTSLRIAAGVILTAIAVDTLITGHKPEKIEAGEYVIVPIATPLIVGPGTMTLLIASSRVYGIPSTLIAALIAFIPTYLLLRFSQAIVRVVGKTFIHGLGRFMSIIIASFAAEMFIEGVRGLIQ